MYKKSDLVDNIRAFANPDPKYMEQNTEMINLMHGAANYSNNKLQKTDIKESDPELGPASISQNNKKIFKWIDDHLPENKRTNYNLNAEVTDSHPTLAILSHEMGHNEDNPTSSIADALPVIGDIRTLWRERQANSESWKFLNNIYKDDPELIKMMGEQRSRVLPKAYGTYLMNNGVPIATTALGGYLGYRRYKNKQKQYDQAVNRINNQLALSEAAKQQQIAKLRKSNKWLNIGVGAGLGYAGGKVIGHVGNVVPGIMFMNQTAKEDAATDAIHQRMIQHAKNHGYYDGLDLTKTTDID